MMPLMPRNRKLRDCQRKPTRSCRTSIPSRSVATGKTRCSSLIAFFNRCSGEQARSFAMSAYIYRIDEGLQFCIKAIQDFAYSGFGGRGGKHGDIFWDNESYAIKHYLKMFADLASATLNQVADWFVWLASTLGRFFDERSGKAERNANELRRADHEVHDIADGRYDGRIQKFQQGISR